MNHLSFCHLICFEFLIRKGILSGYLFLSLSWWLTNYWRDHNKITAEAAKLKSECSVSEGSYLKVKIKTQIIFVEPQDVCCLAFIQLYILNLLILQQFICSSFNQILICLMTMFIFWLFLVRILLLLSFFSFNYLQINTKFTIIKNQIIS